MQFNLAGQSRSIWQVSNWSKINMASEATYAPLVERLVFLKTRGSIPLVLTEMISRELFGLMTLRSLLNLCAVCKIPPTAAMLAIALQNSVPSLTGLPMDNPDPAFYIDIAKRFFRPEAIPIRLKTEVYHSLQPGRFLRGVVGDLDYPRNGHSSGLSYYITLILNSRRDVKVTKKGRDFIKGVALEWLETPLSADMARVYMHLLNVLDHGFVLRNRNLEPGCLGCWTHSIAQDEHL